MSGFDSVTVVAGAPVVSVQGAGNFCGAGSCCVRVSTISWTTASVSCRFAELAVVNLQKEFLRPLVAEEPLDVEAVVLQELPAGALPVRPDLQHFGMWITTHKITFCNFFGLLLVIIFKIFFRNFEI